ncbi:MAG: glucose-6-phosphate dehydrogenase [Gammaproteobacteria bacterium]|jgi:glucose-6-phosphate 1-dehydrogenase
MTAGAADRQAGILVLFGAGGDLAARLVIPALYALYHQDKLPQPFRLLAVDREALSPQALGKHWQGFAKHSDVFDTKTWRDFMSHLACQALDATDPQDFKTLRAPIADFEKQAGKAHRIFYTAVPPSLFAPIAKGLTTAELNRPVKRTRLIVEKPLGYDIDSFRMLNETLREGFEETQIYRIDHFLGKETVQNILALRFANPIFEPLWNRQYIRQVVVDVSESLGVEHRAGYYEKAGALRDMIQNHLIQLLTLVAMEPPATYEAEDLRNRKMDVMYALRPIERAHAHAVRGQYAAGRIAGKPVPGYREETGVAADSNTETFAALRLHIDNWRWEGVPFILRTGKRLDEKRSEIRIHFKPTPHRAFPATARDGTHRDCLCLHLQPQEGISLRFHAKAPGQPLRLQDVNMKFDYQESFQGHEPTAYETLIHDALHGDATLFMRADQAEAAWRLVQPVLDHWAATTAEDFPNYPAGSRGPEAAERLFTTLQDGEPDGDTA